MRKFSMLLMAVTMIFCMYTATYAENYMVRRRARAPQKITTLERPADDTAENHINRLGFDSVTVKDSTAESTRDEKPERRSYDGSFMGLNMYGSNGLIETTSPHTVGRERLQIGFNFIDRRIGNDANRITARASFQHLNFGILDRLELGFGSTGYYKAASNTTYTNVKLRLTNPLRHRFAAAVGARNFDYGSSSSGNVTNYYGALSFPMKYSEFYLNAVNNSTNNVGDLTFAGGLIFNTNYENFRYPVAMMVEGIQDQNNSFNKLNFGIRWVFTENAMIDLILVRDIKQDELSPSVGGTLTF